MAASAALRHDAERNGMLRDADNPIAEKDTAGPRTHGIPESEIPADRFPQDTLTVAHSEITAFAHPNADNTAADDELKEWFGKFDKDGDGEVNMEEFSNVINMMHGDVLPQEVINDMFAELDVDGDGSVSIEEFSVLIGPLRKKIDDKTVTDDELRDAFNTFDRNKDGSLSPEELAAVLLDEGHALITPHPARLYRENASLHV